MSMLAELVVIPVHCLCKCNRDAIGDAKSGEDGATTCPQMGLELFGEAFLGAKVWPGGHLNCTPERIWRSVDWDIFFIKQVEAIDCEIFHRFSICSSDQFHSHDKIGVKEKLFSEKLLFKMFDLTPATCTLIICRKHKSSVLDLVKVQLRQSGKKVDCNKKIYLDHETLEMILKGLRVVFFQVVATLVHKIVLFSFVPIIPPFFGTKFCNSFIVRSKFHAI